MTITIIINQNFLYHFQYYLLEEIISRFQDVKIHVKVEENDQKVNDFNKERFFKRIDRRFSNFKSNPLLKIELDQLCVRFPKITFIDEFQKREFLIDYIIYLYPNPKTAHEYSLLSKKVIKLDLDEKYFFQSCVRKQVYTTIDIHSYDWITLTWNTFQSISFETQKGIYNNRAKALYYSSLLAVRALCKGLNCQITNTVHKVDQSKIFYGFSLTRYYLSLLLIILQRNVNRRTQNWKIAVHHNNNLHFVNQPKGSFWADPFPLINEDKLYIFIEEYNLDTNLGEIALLELDKQFMVVNKTTIIKKDFHLSFPNVFKMEHEYYMMPETSDNNNLCIYKCIDFPLKWTVCSELMNDIKLVDVVWVFHEGNYWLFANKIHPFEHDNNECLFLYYSSDLFSRNWHAHPQNPVVIDIEKARNAGQIYLKKDRLYRPSQNCKDSYGKTIAINEIKELTTEKYSETTITSIMPQESFCGVHTYNRLNDIVVLDYLRQE